VQPLVERKDVADEAVRRADDPLDLAVQVLRPQAVGTATCEERRSALVPRVTPARISRPLVQQACRHERPRRAPHELVRLVRDVAAYEAMEVVGELARRRDPQRREQAGGPPHQERRLVLRR